MSPPTVSVILPVYNGEAYLRSAIESVLAQSLPGVELIVVDDGSTDGTAAIARELGPRLTYVRQANSGVGGAFNHGLRLASGRFISWLSHDDVYLPAKLAHQTAALMRIGAPAVCYTDVEMIDARGETLARLSLPEHAPHHLLRHLATAGPICSAGYSLMFDRACIEEVGVYSEHWRHTQDVEMLLRLGRRFPFVHIPAALIQVREHGQRGIRSSAWEREVVLFFAEQLRTIPLEELFPERPQPAVAYAWLGDALARRSFPMNRLAYAHYGRAWRATRGRDAMRVLVKLAALVSRDAFRRSLRLLLRLPGVGRTLRRLQWRLGAAMLARRRSP